MKKAARGVVKSKFSGLLMHFPGPTPLPNETTKVLPSAPQCKASSPAQAATRPALAITVRRTPHDVGAPASMGRRGVENDAKEAEHLTLSIVAWR